MIGLAARQLDSSIRGIVVAQESRHVDVQWPEGGKSRHKIAEIWTDHVRVF